MNRKQRIKTLLIDKFRAFSIKIEDNSDLHTGHHNFDGSNETHLKVILKKKYLHKINRLEIHRKINDLISDEYENGLHSLEISIS